MFSFSQYFSRFIFDENISIKLTVKIGFPGWNRPTDENKIFTPSIINLE